MESEQSQTPDWKPSIFRAVDKRWLLPQLTLPPVRQIRLNIFKAGRKAQFSRMVTEDTLSLSVCEEFVFSLSKEGTKPDNTLALHRILQAAEHCGHESKLSI